MTDLRVDICAFQIAIGEPEKTNARICLLDSRHNKSGHSSTESAPDDMQGCSTLVTGLCMRGSFRGRERRPMVTQFARAMLRV